jgi:hypothetical protein
MNVKGKIRITFTGVSRIDCFGYAFKDEQDFKRAWMTHLQTIESCDVFEIENEEKEPGFPDLLCINNATQIAKFYEIKVARKGGKFKFEPTQPRFYKTHPALHIYVVVWDAEEKTVYLIDGDKAAAVALEKGKATPKGIYLNVREI